MRRTFALIIALHAVVGGAFVSSPPITVRSQAMPAPQEESDIPGLWLALSTPGGRRDVRPARLAALHVPDGTPASPFLDPGPFTATWTGFLNLDIRTKATFTAAGNGSVRVEIKGKVVLEGTAEDLDSLETKSHRIRKGRNPITITYTAPADDDASFRLYWTGRDFAREPLPPKLLTRTAEAEAGPASARIRNGRMAFAKQQCIRCHRPSKPLTTGYMPELAMGAPSLADAGARFKRPWIAEWIVNPHHMRRDATMPGVFGHETLDAARAASDTRPDDVAAYLASLGKDRRPATITPAGNGGALFAKLGCISCHSRPDHAPDKDGERIPLNRVGDKFHPGALAAFLEKPRSHWAWIRMPDFKLTPAEAGALAGWLLEAAGTAAPASETSGDPARGKALVVSLGCTACHDGLVEEAPKPTAPTLEAIFEADWAQSGCVCEERDTARTPDLGLDDVDRTALTALANPEGLASLRRRSTIEFTERQIEEARCTACHAYDHRADLWASSVTETHDLYQAHSGEGEGKVSQIRPTLTWLGEKLHGRWMASFIRGKLPAVRPWLDARMPAFPTRGRLMASGFAHGHGFPMTEAAAASPTPSLVEAGDQLLNKDGFGCTACHGIGAEKPYATFEFAAPNFDRVHDRIRPEYYLRWMWNPTRVEHRYRMPIYATPDSNETIYDEVLDGVADQQFQAMWHYLQTIGK